jgi:hypothetical protein
LWGDTIFEPKGELVIPKILVYLDRIKLLEIFAYLNERLRENQGKDLGYDWK